MSQSHPCSLTPRSTGVTGYIGGDIFHTLHALHPDWSYTLLVRNPTKGALVAAAYPSVTLIYGDLSATELISRAASEADIVIHAANSDDVSSATAIAAGLAAGHTPEHPGFWIHVSGTGMLMWNDMTADRYGEPPFASGEDRYDDLEGVGKVLAVPETAIHRNVEKIVQDANSEGVRTAIVAPPLIYGPGRGPGNGRSIQVYDMVKYTLEKGYAPVVGTGKTEWHEVHVQDLTDLFVSLAEAAVDGEKGRDEELFGKRAYFFAENGVLVWGEVAELIAKESAGQGFIKEPKVVKVGYEDVVAEGPANSTWALNSKSEARRARKYLSWKPTRRSLKEEIHDLVAGEAKKLGITAKYAK